MALGRRSITPTLIDRTYDEATGLFLPISRPEPGRAPPVTWAALSPLALPDLPEHIGRRLVEEHLLDPERFWLPVPPASVAATEPSFSRRESRLGIKRYWRGPTWVNAAWLVSLGLVRLGYDEHARTLRERLGAAIAREGLREYYDPYSGRGMGATDFGWSTLIAEIVEPDPRARHSFVG
jgi:glycogen debranching enzyme